MQQPQKTTGSQTQEQTDVSASNEKELSFNEFFKGFTYPEKSAALETNQNTTGRWNRQGSAQGRRSSVIVSPTFASKGLYTSIDEANLTWAKLIKCYRFWAKNTNPFDRTAPLAIIRIFMPFLMIPSRTLIKADSQIRVIPTINQQAFRASAPKVRVIVITVSTPQYQSQRRRHSDRINGWQTNHIFDLCLYIRFSSWQIHLVQNCDHLMVGIQSLIHICQCLRFDPFEASTTSNEPSWPIKIATLHNRNQHVQAYPSGLGIVLPDRSIRQAYV